MRSISDLVNEKLLHESCVCCRIVESSGSCPAKEGSVMFVFPGGETLGTIGGGDLEYFCTHEALAGLHERSSFARSFDLSSSKGPVNMACGGSVKVVFSYVEDPKDLEALLGERKARQRVVIFGAGHVCQSLSPLLEDLDFEVLVADDRETLVEKAGSGSVLCDYDDISCVGVQKDDFAVVMTQGHRGDASVLLQLCSIGPHYIGCIGSRRKVGITKDFLRENGVSESVIQSIVSPIGIDINARTVPEIAVSIAAQLISVRALKEGFVKGL